MYEEAEQLKKALERRPVIDMASGVLMATWSCAAEEAWQVLVRVSQYANTKLYDVARAVVAATQHQPVPVHLQDHLAAAATAWRARRADGA
ncbi:ANTAR domain-containing protein [Streptomyces sp. NPDC051001]|uniref:ANTAR domain-containing protein n=1 Tax=Streptomyces sp. NPDC051001 TaxID=3155795 RepID=UPI00341D1DB2